MHYEEIPHSFSTNSPKWHDKNYGPTLLLVPASNGQMKLKSIAENGRHAQHETNQSVSTFQAFSAVSLLSHSTMAGGSGLENKDCDQTLAKLRVTKMKKKKKKKKNLPNSP